MASVITATRHRGRWSEVASLNSFSIVQYTLNNVNNIKLTTAWLCYCGCFEMLANISADPILKDYHYNRKEFTVKTLMQSVLRHQQQQTQVHVYVNTPIVVLYNFKSSSEMQLPDILYLYTCTNTSWQQAWYALCHPRDIIPWPPGRLSTIR